MTTMLRPYLHGLVTGAFIGAWWSEPGTGLGWGVVVCFAFDAVVILRRGAP